MHVPFCVSFFIVLFCVPFVCKCVLYYCQRLSTRLKLTNISISISISKRYLYHKYPITYQITVHTCWLISGSCLLQPAVSALPLRLVLSSLSSLHFFCPQFVVSLTCSLTGTPCHQPYLSHLTSHRLLVSIQELQGPEIGWSKVQHITGHEGPGGEYRYRSTLSLTSALDGVGGQRHVPAGTWLK